VKRSGPLPRRTRLTFDPEKVRAWRRRTSRPLPARSQKRIGEAPIRAEVRSACFARDHYRCRAVELADGCQHDRLECDEIQGRGRRPGSHLVLEETQSLCWVCHRLKTDHPRVAGLLGLYGDEEMRRRLEEIGPPGDMARVMSAVDAAEEWARMKRSLLGG
jgi:hypothetical protein